MHPLLNIAVRAARSAGDAIVRYLGRLDSLAVRDKGGDDPVSDLDREAEARIVDVIRHAYPDHAILAEESGHHPGSGYEWLVDPLDGTRNYLRGLPHFAVSIAVRHRGRLEQGVVFDPVRQELFTASRGAGASLDNRRIRVAARSRLGGALIATGFTTRRSATLDTHLDEMRALCLQSAHLRRSGSAALDLAYVAAGRLDGYWQWGLAPWDLAAGTLLVREAGGMVTGRNGADDAMQSGDVVAAGPKVLRAMLPLLRDSARVPASGARAAEPEAGDPEAGERTRGKAGAAPDARGGGS